MRWTVHGERFVYESPWVAVSLVDVEIPGERRFEHHAVRMPFGASGTVVHDRDRGVLLLWRHRFITDTWGWEVPAGGINADESPADAAAREVLEETGWRPGPLTLMTRYHPTNGLSDQTFWLFLADGATYETEPVDVAEAERIEWVPVDELRAIIARDEMPDGLSLTASLYALAFAGIGA